MKTLLSALALSIVATTTAHAASTVSCKLDLDNYPGFEQIVTLQNDGKSKDLNLTYNDKVLAEATVSARLADGKTVIDFSINESADRGGSHVRMTGAALSNSFQATMGSIFFTCQQGKMAKTPKSASWN